MSTPVINIHPEHPDEDALNHTAGQIRAGGVVVFPTQCLYGLGANACDAEAVARLFRIKRRDPSKPILILIGPHHNLADLVTHIPSAAQTLMDRFWPGNLTVVLPAHASLPQVLTSGSGTIGVRMAGHPVARHLLSRLDTPLTGTSANLSGQDGCFQIADLAPDILSAVDGVLDAGPLKGGVGSTIVDATGPTLHLLREGVIAAAALGV